MVTHMYVKSLKYRRVKYRGGGDPSVLPPYLCIKPWIRFIFFVHKLLMIATVAMVRLFGELLACRVRLEWIVQVWWLETACGLAMCM